MTALDRKNRDINIRLTQMQIGIRKKRDKMLKRIRK
jgi:hypothetical protein